MKGGFRNNLKKFNIAFCDFSFTWNNIENHKKKRKIKKKISIFIIRIILELWIKQSKSSQLQIIFYNNIQGNVL